VISVVAAGKHKLVRLRNPWGNFEWKGAFSDKDKANWTPEMMKLCKITTAELENDEDGLFFMTFDDFLAHFTRVSVCMTRHGKDEPWFEKRIQSSFVKNNSVNGGLAYYNGFISVSFPAQTEGYLTLHQPDVRVVSQKEMKYLSVGILIINADTNEMVCQSDMSIERQHTFFINLKKGKYLIMPYMDDHLPTESRPCCFSAHLDVIDAANNVVMNEIPFSTEIFDRFVVASALTLPKKYDSPDFCTYSGFIFGTLWCFLCCHVAKNTEVEFELDFPTADNMRIINNQSNSSSSSNNKIETVKKTAQPGPPTLIVVLCRHDLINPNCGTGQFEWSHAKRSLK